MSFAANCYRADLSPLMLKMRHFRNWSFLLVYTCAWLTISPLPNGHVIPTLPLVASFFLAYGKYILIRHSIVTIERASGAVFSALVSLHRKVT